MVLSNPARPLGNSSRYCQAWDAEPETSIQTMSVEPEPFMSANSIWVVVSLVGVLIMLLCVPKVPADVASAKSTWSTPT